MIEPSRHTDVAKMNGRANGKIEPTDGETDAAGTAIPAPATPFPYIFRYSPESVYGNVVRLAAQYIAPGLIVDLGAGVGAVGTPLEKVGFAYVAVERDEEALRLLTQRDIRNHECDLSDPASLEKTLDAIGSAKAYLLIDVLEHLEHPETVLQSLAAYAREHGSPYLLISVPNVSHRDVAYNLLGGHWNITDTGLLDRTHLHFFAAPSLLKLLTASGWQLVTRDDFTLRHSDQYDAQSLLHNESLLGDFLRYVSDTFNPDNQINQFLWLLKPSAPHAEEIVTTETKPGAIATKPPLVSLLIRTQGKRNDLLTEALYSIYAQDCDDYEAIICFHKPEENDDLLLDGLHTLMREIPVHLQTKIRLIECAEQGRSAPLNALIEAARGDYFGFLDDDDLLFARHVSTLKRGVETHGIGPIFQTFAARRRTNVRKRKPTPDDFGFQPQGSAAVQGDVVTYPYAVELIEAAWTAPYDPLTQQYANDIPNCCFLVPRLLIEQTNMRFRLDFELAEDWEFLMRAAQFLKVVTLPEITAAINVRNNESNTVQNADLQPEWAVAHRKRLDEQAKRPLLLEGHIARLLFRRHIETAIKREQLEGQLAAQSAQMERHAAQVAEVVAQTHENQQMIEWAHSLEQTLLATQQEHERLSAWARNLERQVQSRRRRGPLSLVRWVVRKIR
ncbi:MAG: methyltransferase domain-containing protein [Chloroflexota bacterium]|nr:methyltransferase domain-containing protein [Chloroflexota bacterium]